MAAENRTVLGRQFRTQADYEAAQRDKKKIDSIRARLNMQNKEAVLSLYAELQAGGYRFETMIGNDFDDEIYDLAMKYKQQSGQGQEQKDRNRKQKHDQNKDKNQSKDKNQKQKQNIKQKKEQSQPPISLNDFDEDMRKEIQAQLAARDKRRKWLLTICSLCAVFSLGYFFIYYFFAERTSADYEQLASLKNSDVLSGEQKVLSAIGHEEEIILPDILKDYQTLYNKNKKLIGWLQIDDTIIDYPVMQTSNNEYYLTNNFNQEYDKNGSIFMDYECKAYPRSKNLILYGHHMKSGRMFGDLAKYKNKLYWENHKIVRFDTIYEKSTYEVMYVFKTRVYKENEIAFKYYQFIDANSEEEFNSYMKEMAEMALYETEITASYGDELLTLSTCDNSQTDGRFVVVARRVT